MRNAIIGGIGVITFVAGYIQGKKERVHWNYDFHKPIFGKVLAATPFTPAVTNNQPTTSRISQIMKYGFPGLENIRSFDDYVLSYDRRTRVAYWVFEHLTKENIKSNETVDRSLCEFKPDESIHPYFRSLNSDFKGSGYDRGHLAAAEIIKAAKSMLNKRFIYQIWLHNKEADGKNYVKYEVIGANNVAVPTHFFKVVVMETVNGAFEMEAFVMPNQPIDDSIPLSSFQVPPDSIERSAGLLFFDNLSKEKINKINGKRK